MKFLASALLLASSADAFLAPTIRGAPLNVLESSPLKSDVEGVSVEKNNFFPGSGYNPGNYPPPGGYSGPGTDSTRRLEERLNDMDRNPNREYSPEDSPAAIITDSSRRVPVQGGSLKTWSYAHPSVERIHVVLRTDGRPLDADVGLWQGPDNTPHKMRVYVEDGKARPFSAVIETPRSPNTVSIRNTGQLEFPLHAHVLAEDGRKPSILPAARKNNLIGEPLTIQGGALRTYPFDPSVESVAVLLKTDGRPLNSRIELLQGPNNNKQVVEIYTEDGLERPFFMVIETPGSGNVVRVVNSATVEFPLTAWVEAHHIGESSSPLEPVIGGDDDGMRNDGFVRQW